ncbi:hypothetical protein RQP46_004165 [Phenoliferia psychrophenolica]
MTQGTLDSFVKNIRGDANPPAKLVKLSDLSPSATETPSRLERSTRLSDGKELVSRGTWISDSPTFIEEQENSNKEDEELKRDLFKSLPSETLARIIAEVELAALEDDYRKLEKMDLRRTGWVLDKGIYTSIRKHRCAALLPLLTVSRQVYHLAIRQLWTHLDLSGAKFDGFAYTTLNKLIETASKPVSIAAVTATADSTEPPSDATTTPADSPPTHGSFVRAYTAGKDGKDEIPTFIGSLLPHLSSLSALTLTPSANLKNSSLASLAVQLGPSLKSLDHLTFNATEDDLARIESLISLHNRAVNLEHWSVRGLVLSEANAKRLAFVLKLNSLLVHKESGAKGVGLRELYLGHGCSFPISFLRNLQVTAPHLTKLWIKAGVSIVADSTAQGQLPFDLRSFAQQWGGQLTALTLVGTHSFSTQGYFNDILILCPLLTTLHLRSDHITFAFFRTLKELCLPESPMDVDASSSPKSPNSSEHDDVDVEPARLKLQSLAIQHRLPIGDATTTKGLSSITIPRQHLHIFSYLILLIEAKGLVWPTEMAGQRDVLDRASWMLASVVEKRSTAAEKKAREEEESERAIKKKAELMEDSDSDDGNPPLL